MIAYETMTVIDRARAARLILENPVFVHVVDKELSGAIETAINHPDLDARETNRQHVLCLRSVCDALKIIALPQEENTDG